ncbi:lysozyme inhibitor LprI family protein [Xanthomonas nasturtii]|uniref:lysozyme inhibitor LprI family protein n=1 Tax=Xanthomonas nasturtii TaxID=1843581 RepID=UPI0020133452|nr:lysozyme inhibitor LprI family protein [Xanthomonas nasturtii]MCL1501506.1 lysozyme inhibitor LprI family protein [Xanthomonas nasturtii]MCL1505421.1 lysozyme inhibitor LprI family protein [Xanthomonas nasturtii]MCL1524913.1 lysozyme inhibitor LprI family protein [Xanthomonas nasturtii]
MDLKNKISSLVVISILLLCSCKQEANSRTVADTSKQQHVLEAGNSQVENSENKAKQKLIAQEQDQLLDSALDSGIQEKRGDLAKKAQLRPFYTKCIKESNAVHPVMMDCNKSEYEYQDARLNKVYQALMRELAKDEKVELKQEERDWITQRDALCRSNGALGGGQAEELEDSSCMLNATAARAGELEKR